MGNSSSSADVGDEAKAAMQPLDKELEGAGAGYVVEQESKIYGHALINAMLVGSFVLVLSSQSLTKWTVSVEVQGTEGPQGLMPGVKKETWGFAVQLALLLLFAVRCTFSIATGSPRPLPGDEIKSWECALPCLASLLLSGAAFFGLAYYLPQSLGAELEFHFLDLMPFVLNVTVGIALAKEVMRSFLDWKEGRKIAPQPRQSANSGAQALKVRRKKKKKKKNEHGASNADTVEGQFVASPRLHHDPRKEKNRDKIKGKGIGAKIVGGLSIFASTLISVGCESCSMREIQIWSCLCVIHKQSVLITFITITFTAGSQFAPTIHNKTPSWFFLSLDHRQQPTSLASSSPASSTLSFKSSFWPSSARGTALCTPENSTSSLRTPRCTIMPCSTLIQCF